MTYFQDVVRAYRGAWSRRRVFVPLYLVMQLLLVALVAPGVAGLVNLAVSLSDQPALTDQDIAFFLLSPLGFLAALAVLSVFLVAEVLSFSVMAASLRAQSGDVWHAVGAGLSLALRRLPALLGFALRFILRVLALSAPFAALAGVVAWWTLTDYDINYYLTFKPPAFVVAAVLIGLIALALAWALIRQLSSWALALHLVLFENSRPGAAFGGSAALMQGRRGGLKLRLFWWLAVRLLITAALALVTGLLVTLIPVADEDNLVFVLRLSMAVLVLSWLAGYVLSAIALAALAELLDGLYGGAGRIRGNVRGRSLRLGLLGGLGLAGIALLAGGWIGNRMMDAVSAPVGVAVIAHRGAAGARPENTMAAVERAIEDAADWIEIDVQETADGTVVVMHDSDYMKLAGMPLKIWDATMDDLAEIDIGSWFDPAFAGERTPTLRDVLEVARGRSSVLIELKYYGQDEDLENRVANIVDELEMRDEIAVMSLKYPAVQKMQALRPDWRTGVLAATAVGNLARLDGDFIAVSTATARPALIREVQAAGKDIYVWTVNDPLEMARMVSLGVDGLITDEPALAREVLRFRDGLSPAELLLLRLTGEMDLDRDETADDRP